MHQTSCSASVSCLLGVYTVHAGRSFPIIAAASTVDEPFYRRLLAVTGLIELPYLFVYELDNAS